MNDIIYSIGVHVRFLHSLYQAGMLILALGLGILWPWCWPWPWAFGLGLECLGINNKASRHIV